MKYPFVLLGILFLSGCGLQAKVDARNDYASSTNKYKDCLNENPSTPQKCEGYRLAMEADEKKFNAMSAGINPGSQRSSVLTIQNR